MNLKNKKSLSLAKVYTAVFGLSMVLLMFAACKKEKTEVVKEPLKVTDYYPNSGNQGTLVTIEGTGFSNDISAVSATFAGSNAEVVSATTGAVVLRAPINGSSGALVMKMNGTELAIGPYTYQELSVQRISPTNGSAGTHVRISGAGFSSVKGPAQVLINGKPSTIVSATDTLLVVEVPVAAGTGPVKVIVDGKEALGQTFKSQAITGIKPLTGGKGTLVTISGAGFEELAEGNYVDFNGKQALVKTATANQLVVVAPTAVQTGPLSVTINKQKVTGPVFTVVPPPVIVSVSPLSGPAGSVMTITGTTFSTVPEENKVTINGKLFAVSAASALKLTLVIPGGTGNGKVVLSVNDQVVQGPDFKDQSLGISKLSPENGLSGSEVTISGTGFSTVGAENKVTFNGLSAVVISATETSLVVKAPLGLTSGPLKVSLNGAEAIAPKDFNRAGIVTIARGPELAITDFRTGSMAVDRQGNVFVVEIDMNKIKKITPQGTVTLFAGSPTGQRGNKNGQGTEALFNFGGNVGMTIDDDDNLYVSDYINQSIRKITPGGLVSNFAVNIGQVQKITFDENGILYVLGSFSGGWKFDKSGNRTSINPQTMADVARPVVLNNKLYKVNNEGNFIDQYDLNTNSQVYRYFGAQYGYQDGIGNSASFSTINGLILDGAGTMYVSDNENLAIRKINMNTKEVTTVFKLTKGELLDGSFDSARAKGIGDIIVDKEGNLYFIDAGNNALRKVLLK